jgi:ankyrin repeat protein
MAVKDLQIHQLALAGRAAALASLLAEDHRWLMARGMADRTPLHCAALAGSPDCIKVLLFRGQYSNVVLARPHSLPAEKALLLENRASFIDIPESAQGWTPLFCAVDSGSIESMQLLLEAGADPNYQSHEQRTPLTYARSKASLELLVSYGARQCEEIS